MLVLTRKSTEEIRIGTDIIVKVIAIRGGQVKLGIDAPRGIRVSRVEGAKRMALLPPIKSENREHASNNLDGGKTSTT